MASSEHSFDGMHHIAADSPDHFIRPTFDDPEP